MNGSVGERHTGVSVALVFIDDTGITHGWEINPADVSWEMTGLQDGRTTARITAEGPFLRRRRNFGDLTIEPPAPPLPG